MCFSSNASFAASGILSLIGCASVYSTQKNSWKFLACTPLFFAIQQCAEGIVWLTIAHESSLLAAATLTYIFIAYVFWPMWIPFTLALIEQENRRKKIIVALLSVGSVFSLLALWCLMKYGIVAKVVGHHLVYYAENTTPITLGTLFPYLKIVYVAIVILPFLISSVALMPLMGIAIMGAYAATELWYQYYITSVWCFFSALLSALLYFIIVYNQKHRSSVR